MSRALVGLKASLEPLEALFKAKEGGQDCGRALWPPLWVISLQCSPVQFWALSCRAGPTLVTAFLPGFGLTDILIPLAALTGQSRLALAGCFQPMPPPAHPASSLLPQRGIPGPGSWRGSFRGSSMFLTRKLCLGDLLCLQSPPRSTPQPPPPLPTKVAPHSWCDLTPTQAYKPEGSWQVDRPRRQTTI